MDSLKALFDLSKLPAKFFILFALVSGFILFANSNVLGKLQMESLKVKYGWIIGLTFITSSILTLINLLIWLTQLFDRIYWNYIFKKEIF